MSSFNLTIIENSQKPLLPSQMTIHNLAVCLAPSIFHDVINPNISFPSVKSHESTSKKSTLNLLTPYRKNYSMSSNSNSSKENNNAFTTHINTINVFKEIKLKLSNSGDSSNSKIDSNKGKSICEIKDNLLNGGVGLDGQKDSKISIPKLVEFLSYMIHFREEIFQFEDEIDDLTVEN